MSKQIKGKVVIAFLPWHSLRVRHDQPILDTASKLPHDTLLPVTFIDDRYVAIDIKQSSQSSHSCEQSASTTQPKSYWHNLDRSSTNRELFHAQSIKDIKEGLIQLNSNLLVLIGHPEAQLPSLVDHLHTLDLQVTGVVTEQAIAHEELNILKKLGRALKDRGVPLHRTESGNMMIDPTVLFNSKLSDLPEVYTQFRVKVEAHAQRNDTTYRAMAKKITKLAPFPDLAFNPESTGGMQWISATFETAKDCKNIFTGGESIALARVSAYLQRGKIDEYKETRNGLVGLDYSSKFSPFLATGAISARYILSRLQRFEETQVSNKSTYWMLFELLWRDYFAMVMLKHGTLLFQREGFRADTKSLYPSWARGLSDSRSKRLFEAWVNGLTGYPLVDASMRELAATGYTSNRARQNVASFLCHTLALDWTAGAEYFESMLLDYDPCSNWGNWTYAAGVGNDPRSGSRVFNIVKQGSEYDADGEFVKLWIPELRGVSVDKIHVPWSLSLDQKKAFGADAYPPPIVPVPAAWNRGLKYPSKTGRSNTNERVRSR